MNRGWWVFLGAAGLLFTGCQSGHTKNFHKKKVPASDMWKKFPSTIAYKVAPAGVAAYVDDEIIMCDEVNKICSELHLSFPEALNFLIEQKLLFIDFKKKGGKISNLHLEAQLETIAKEHFRGNRVLMQQVFKQRGQSLYGVKEDLRNSMIFHAMQQQQMQSPYSISPRQMLAYYKAHQSEFQVEARYCLQQSGFLANDLIEAEFSFQKNGITEKLPAVRMTKQERWKQLMNHAIPLLDIQKHLDSFRTEPTWYAASELDPHLLQALASLSVGQSTPYLLLNGNYLCSTLVKFEPARVKALPEVQNQIEEALLVELNEKRYKQYLQRLREQASITIFS